MLLLLRCDDHEAAVGRCFVSAKPGGECFHSICLHVELSVYTLDILMLHQSEPERSDLDQTPGERKQLTNVPVETSFFPEVQTYKRSDLNSPDRHY